MISILKVTCSLRGRLWTSAWGVNPIFPDTSELYITPDKREHIAKCTVDPVDKQNDDWTPSVSISPRSNGVDLLNYKKELLVSLQTINIMRTQNRYLKICIYWKLPIYLMSSVWNFGASSQILHFQTIFDLCSNTIAVYIILKPGTTIECMFFQPERLVYVTTCDIASQN